MEDNEELHNIPLKKSKRSEEGENDKLDHSVNGSFKQQHGFHPHAERFVKKDTSVSHQESKKTKKHKHNQQFGTQFPHKQNFNFQRFNHNKKAQNNDDSVQITDSSGKKIVSSNSRLGAFEINPKKFKNNLIYGKKHL
ncbi:hypothetical protein CEXT_493811 [Caerostris extrusa]|uniref:Uncharacterized protein n=1 Tax=Caerostris extrusa TaxID=172846 RepID=A0AAV4M760_CAEEX|nr:hypothetical protein CEXT_493811 [Caerostris extrusa]